VGVCGMKKIESYFFLEFDFIYTKKCHIARKKAVRTMNELAAFLLPAMAGY
jgi:hypothetical protein